jgi:hypothetical protein
LLQTHITQGADLACEHARISLCQRAQPGQKTRQTITRAGISGVDRSGLWSEATILPRGQTPP